MTFEKGLSDLDLGDQKVTWKNLVGIQVCPKEGISPTIHSGDEIETINPTRSGAVWILTDQSPALL